MSSDCDHLKSLETSLNYSFQDKGRAMRALTHASTLSEYNYERLEFLGDRVLGLAIAELLFKRFKQESEGDMAKRHAALVSGATIAKHAKAMALGKFIKFSEAERHAGGEENENILADVFEALVGAVYLESDMDTCRDIIETLWGDTIHVLKEPPREPKTALQEWAQGRGLGLPVYEIHSQTGPDHSPVFEMRVSIEGHGSAMAKGSSRRDAEKKAAQELLSQLEG